ncbi:MAG: invasion associated locus B family protein, partial [Hyphomicrobium sp.]|nr:invasion associated locus B family protein [Hyphomicrobium sp.]
SPLPGGASSIQETFDAWTVNCAEQKGAKHCSMAQEQVDQHSRQRVIAIELGVAPAGKIKGTLILPFGLALAHGVRLQIDSAPAEPTLPIRTCVPIGCLVSLTFDAKSVAALRKATTLKVEAVADSGNAADFSISLKGFPAALDRTAALAK